nr:tRNA adenosine(34) deaminase TadA [Patulibacter sp. SYSU D01012]
MPPLDHERWMREAIVEAREAERHGDVPIGAVVVADDGTVLGRGRNERERDEDPTAHAEILALRGAAAALGTWRVHDATLYVTLEPCAMCAGAIVLSRIPRVVYGCTDPKAGACGSVLDVTAEPRLNHRPDVVGGVLADDCAGLLRAFFAARRGRRKRGTPRVGSPAEG